MMRRAAGGSTAPPPPAAASSSMSASWSASGCAAFSRSRCSLMMERTRESLYLSRVSVRVDRRDSMMSWVASSQNCRPSLLIVSRDGSWTRVLVTKERVRSCDCDRISLANVLPNAVMPVRYVRAGSGSP